MYTPIQLDKIRNFRYGMQAIDRIEKKLKKKINTLEMDDMSMGDTAIILWAGLVHEDDKLTPQKVMELVDDHSSIKIAVRKMGEAFKEAFGKDDDDEDEGEKEKN